MYQRKNLNDYYKALVGRKAQFPKSMKKLQNNFNLLLQQLTQIFSSHTPWLLNLTSELFSIKFSMVSSIPIPSCTKKVTFQAISVPSVPGHQSRCIIFFIFCPFSKTFWSDFKFFWHLLTNEKIQVHVPLQDITVGVVTTKCPSHHLLNYMLLISKIYLWVCRATKTSPKIHGFKKMIVAKYETE